MCNDITFCGHEECPAKECARHRRHAPIGQPVSVTMFDCPYLPIVIESKPQTDLTGKCGSCVYAKPTIAFGGSKSWVACTNEEHLRRRVKHNSASVRQRTHKACKCYRAKEDVICTKR